MRDGCEHFAGSGNIEPLDRKVVLVEADGADEAVREEVDGSKETK